MRHFAAFIVYCFHDWVDVTGQVRSLDSLMSHYRQILALRYYFYDCRSLLWNGGGGGLGQDWTE